MPEGGQGPLPGIQVLRAVAALLVVVHHTQLNITQGFGLPAALPRFDVGSAGVDIFFVISGFIMVVSAQNLFGRAGAPGIFVARRLIRIVPLYWAITTLYVLATLLVSPGHNRVLSAADLAASYLFLPLLGPDGIVPPALVVGWTLNYEMFFYALFAVALLAQRRWGVFGVVACLIALVLAHETGQVAPAPLLVWSDPIVLEFAMGMLAGLTYLHGVRIPRPLALVLMVLAVLALAVQWSAAIPHGALRPVVYGLPAAALTAGASLEKRPAFAGWLRPAASLGDASYSLYLLHLPVLWAGRIGATKLRIPMDRPLASYLLALACILASVAAATVCFRYAEAPMTKGLRRIVARRSTRKRSDAIELFATADGKAA